MVYKFSLIFTGANHWQIRQNHKSIHHRFEKSSPRAPRLTLYNQLEPIEISIEEDEKRHRNVADFFLGRSLAHTFVTLTQITRLFNKLCVWPTRNCVQIFNLICLKFFFALISMSSNCLSR